MNKKTKIAIICIVAILLVVGIIVIYGISNNNKVEANENPIKATSVKFSKSGQYTTTVTSDKVDLSGINADNVEISYIITNNEEVNGEINSTNETIKAKVESVTKNNNEGFDIVFTDEKASEYAPASYSVIIKDSDNGGSIQVEFPQIKLTPDIEFVTANSDTTKVTLTIDGSEFEDEITKDDIILDDSFSEMTIESISSSNKNLTMQLSGTPIRNKVVNAYLFGTISVKPNAIKDGFTNNTAKIDIKLDYADFDASSLKYADGKISGNIVVYGIADVNSLTKDNVKLDGVTVETVEKKDENTLAVTMTVNGINNVNEFADLVNNKTLKLGNTEVQIQLPQAYFYPVFDYVEKDGDNFKLTLKLYAFSGIFNNNLNSDMLSFSDDFESAKVESVKVESNGLATVILTVPANDQTVETMEINGTLTLKAGALTNNWNEVTSKECSFNRYYNGETLGRDVTLNADTLLEIQKYTRGLNTTFGKICYWGGVAGQVGSIAKTLLEATGILQSEHAQIMQELEKINTKLDAVLGGIDTIRQDLVLLMDGDNRILLSTYNSNFTKLETKVRNVNNVYARARQDLAKENPKYANIDWDNMTDAEAVEYNHALIDFITEKAKDTRNYNYVDFNNDSKELKEAFEAVTGALKSKGDYNPIMLYDQSCSYKYNFDSQCYEVRLAQRVAAETLLTKALSTLAIRYDVASDPWNVVFASLSKDYSDALKTIKSLDDIGHPAKEIKASYDQGERDPNYYPFCYVLGKKVAIRTRATTSPVERKDWKGAIYQIQSKNLRDWTDYEISTFIRRTTAETLRDEGASAGLNIAAPNLATKLYAEYVLLFQQFQIHGDYIQTRTSNFNTNKDELLSSGIVTVKGQSAEDVYKDFCIFATY